MDGVAGPAARTPRSTGSVRTAAGKVKDEAKETERRGSAGTSTTESARRAELRTAPAEQTRAKPVAAQPPHPRTTVGATLPGSRSPSGSERSAAADRAVAAPRPAPAQEAADERDPARTRARARGREPRPGDRAFPGHRVRGRDTRGEGPGATGRGEQVLRPRPDRQAAVLGRITRRCTRRCRPRSRPTPGPGPVSAA